MWSIFLEYYDDINYWKNLHNVLLIEKPEKNIMNYMMIYIDDISEKYKSEFIGIIKLISNVCELTNKEIVSILVHNDYLGS